MTTDDVIAAYLQLRTMKETLVAKHKEELAPVQDKLNKCLAWVQQQMQNQGLQNLKGQSGIAFLQRDSTFKIQDWNEFYAWVQENHAPAFLEQRVCKSAAQEYVEANGTLPPGLSVSTSIEARIRKA